MKKIIKTHTRVIHVLDVFVGSPMYNAGFQSNTDYILGTTHYIFKDIQDFSEYVSLHQNKSIELVVYNSKEGKTRTLALTPNPKWGGAGSLGGNFGFGHIHSMPIKIINKEIAEQIKDSNEQIKEKNEEKKEENKVEAKTENLEVNESDVLIENKP